MTSQMTYQNMKIQCLPPTVTIDNFVQGIGKYSYEDYLREVVNASDFFLNKSNGEKYHKPLTESHGESDCISVDYTLDFKLLVAQTLLQAERLFADQIRVNNGITSYGISRMTPDNPAYKPITPTRLHAALRPLHEKELRNIKDTKGKNLDRINRDIQSALKIMGVQKNILYFFPYNLYFDVNDDLERGKNLALRGMNDDFYEVFKYRSQECPDHDTYLCFLYVKHFVVSEWNGRELQCVDMIPIGKSPLFLRLLYLAGSLKIGGYLK